MNKEIFKDMTYGMFVISTKFNGKNVGCFVNTAVQITSSSMLVAVSVNKGNYTNKAIKSTKKFAISILSENTNPEVIGKFGFFCSKDVDKFADFNILDIDNMPVVSENICGYMICELVNVVSADTHDVFIAKIIDSEKVSNLSPMTYSYYHSVIKGKAPKTAPTYVEEEQTKQKGEFKKYRCTICGHIYDEEKEGVKFADLPDDWTCPICCVGKELFEEV